MDQPVPLPRHKPTRSYWQEHVLPNQGGLLDEYKTSIPGYYTNSAGRTEADIPAKGESESVERADVLIVGSGITGAGVAWNLLEGVGDSSSSDGSGKEEDKKGMRVVMVEAREACGGATGRNGGHTKAASYRSFLNNTSTLGLEEAIKIAKLELANIRAVHAFARDHDLQCDSWTGDTVDIFYDEAEWQRAQRAVAAMRAAMPEEVEQGAARYRFWTAEEARSNFHCQSKEDIPLGAVTYEAGSLSAYSFVMGLLKMCIQKGLELLTSTPVVKLTRDTDAGSTGWIAQTTGGVIRAKQVVLATNAYTAFLRDEFRGSIIPLRGQITAQRPGLHMPQEGLEHTYSFVYNGGYDYMITRQPGSRHAGDLLIGGGFGKAPLLETGNTDDGGLNLHISAYLADSLRRYIGSQHWGDDHPAGRIRCEWSGIMGYTPDGNPFVGNIPGETGLWVSAGFQGHGMVSCWMCAWALGLMMSGKGGSESLWNWFPRAWEISEARLERTADVGLYVKKIEREEH